MRNIDFSFVQQPTATTCVHACLSMVTGVPVDDLVTRFSGNGLSFHEEFTALVEHGIWPDVITRIDHNQQDGFWFVSAPSLNLPGRLHRIVVEQRDGDFIVHDPNSGRAGVKSYPSNALHGGEPVLSVVEPVRLDTTVLRKMIRPQEHPND